MLSKTLSRKASVVVAMLALASTTLSGSPALAANRFAHHSAAVSPFDTTNCWVIVAQLNGAQPPTTTCLLERLPGQTTRPDTSAELSTSKIASYDARLAAMIGREAISPFSRPRIGTVTCNNSGTAPQLQLWADASYTGSELCLFGQGSNDLSVWGFDNIMTSWNNPNVNNAPSGKIYQGSGETGSSFSFGPGGHNPNVGSGWNDTASSVCISVYPCP